MNRTEAINTLTKGLENYFQGGVRDNRDFLIQLLQQPSFVAARLNTHFVEQHPFSSLTVIQQRQILTTAALYQHHVNAVVTEWNQWQSRSKVILYLNDAPVIISLNALDNGYQISLPDGHCRVSASWKQEDNGCSGVIELARLTFACRVIPLPGHRLKIILPDCSCELGLPGYNSGKPGNTGNALAAPMNGTVTKIMVTEGENVDQGAALMIVEAMKMEHCIVAPGQGVVDEILFQSGDRVESGALLLSFRENHHEAE